MLKKAVLVVLGLIALALVAGAVGLTWAHLAIRRERAPLPAPLVAAAPADQLPVRLSFINTASQRMPRSAVLDASRDPQPQAPYVMSHPSFVVQWADGRLLLVDVGMTREGAISFGGTIEMLGDAAPIEAHGSVAERLGAGRQQVQGIVFTHLHTDHVGGIGDLCRGVGHPLPVFMTQAQDERTNFTTRPGQRLLRDAACVRRERLAGTSPLPVPGFPGVVVIPAGGHTPGSQMVVAFVKDDRGVRRYLLVGDIVNNIDGITHNLPKPSLYSLLVVPEDAPRLAELRKYLRALRDESGVALLVSHDQLDIERTGVPAW
jgi:glyoxylase-like metal-dependent hydrolase (beta-lactamase superfamily II)